MLESDNDPTDTPTSAEQPAGPAAKKATKKAAAKKAAAKKAVTKKAVAKKSPAKKVAAAAAANAPAEAPPAEKTPAAQPAAEAVEPEKAPPSKPARKRATKKAAAVAPPAGEPSAAEVAPTDPTAAEAAMPVMAAPGVLFVAPVEDAKPARRRARKAAAPVVAEEPEPGEVDITAAEELEDETAEPEDVKEAALELATGARRRRRRGRRGRGGAGRGGEAAEVGGEQAETEAPAQDAAPVAETAETGTHRRRRRRRSGEEGGDDGAEEPGTVVHVREPKAPDDGVKAVKGSTRLEAKRQRRKDGRDTTRRRAPILSEAEFLARREAVDRVMAVRQSGDRTQIAVLEDGILVEHYVTRASSTSYVGNVYLGRVQNVLPSMEAAFVDIGKGRNGVLYAGEVNWDLAGLEGKSRAIENALKSGDTVLVQVTKDPIGHKGARLTSQISLPGRFLVYVPGGGMTGISRRLPDNERHRLKSILKKIVPDDAGVIVRTAAEGATEEDLTRDVDRLKAEWETIQAKAKQTKSAPTLVHGEPDLATRVVRDVFNEDFKQLVVQGDAAWATVSEYIGAVAPDLTERMSRHASNGDLFHDLRVDEQLMKALDRKVWLPSGGSLVIDRTEAMTVIDVNTGKFVGAGGNLEQTVTRNNIEAAEEIVRQLRLRDVGGIVVIDFIDMVLESNRELVLRRLTECLSRDRTKHQVAEVTSLGLVQMTRKRVGEGLLEAFSDTCDCCKGRGLIIHTEPVDRANNGGGRDEDERPSGRAGKRKRGRGAAATTEAVEVIPPEQRKAATAAIQAIHKAAAGEKDEAGDGERVDELAIELVEAVTDLPTVPENEPEPIAAELPPTEPEPATQATPEPEPVETAEAAPAPRRRRRVASRPAGPPGAA
jgi:ribonuclease E